MCQQLHGPSIRRELIACFTKACQRHTALDLCRETGPRVEDRPRRGIVGKDWDERRRRNDMVDLLERGTGERRRLGVDMRLGGAGNLVERQGAGRERGRSLADRRFW